MCGWPGTCHDLRSQEHGVGRRRYGARSLRSAAPVISRGSCFFLCTRATARTDGIDTTATAHCTISPPAEAEMLGYDGRQRCASGSGVQFRREETPAVGNNLRHQERRGRLACPSGSHALRLTRRTQRRRLALTATQGNVSLVGATFDNRITQWISGAHPHPLPSSNAKPSLFAAAPCRRRNGICNSTHGRAHLEENRRMVGIM